MRIAVRMTKINGGKALRTQYVEGTTDELPQVGKQFVVWCDKALDPKVRAMSLSCRRVNSARSWSHSRRHLFPSLATAAQRRRGEHERAHQPACSRCSRAHLHLADLPTIERSSPAY